MLFADAESVEQSLITAKQGDLVVSNSGADLTLLSLLYTTGCATLPYNTRKGHALGWALFQGEHLPKLINNITELVGGLGRLFPAAESNRKTGHSGDRRSERWKGMTGSMHTADGFIAEGDSRVRIGDTVLGEKSVFHDWFSSEERSTKRSCVGVFPALNTAEWATE
jgi:hypothetical protein